MEKSAPSDPELLSQWLGQQQEAAFHALVERYASLVHATALRTSRDGTIAAEVSQLTFITLARKARSLTTCASLGGWLHTTSVMHAKNLVRKSRREERKRQLMQDAMETGPPHNSENIWKEMRPVLDEALEALSAKDREALILRFYRSLSIREIATTLGIATDAAQKRVDRATDRLRGKLARRGCQAGGSLAAAMLAGFASDAQAAVPTASFLTSQALAGSSAATSTTLLSTLLIMKTASFVSPAIVLVIAGAWIVSQHQTIHALDRQSDLLQAAIMERHQTASLSSEPKASGKSPTASQSGNYRRIDWAQLVAKMEASDFNDMDLMMFEQQTNSMSQEELLGAMDEIGRLAIPDNLRGRLEGMILFPFSRKFPEFAVIHLTARQLDGGIGGEYLAQAMETWARKDPEKAFAWMDQQIAAGLFESKYLDGKNWTRILYEGVLIRSLLTAEGDRLSQWFDRLPADLHKDVLQATVSVWTPHGGLGAAEEEALAGLVRAKLSSEDQMGVFVRRADEACSGGLDAVDRFFETIKATPEEKLRCVGEVVKARLRGVVVSRTATREDLVGLREWMSGHAPQSVDQLTGEMLGSAAASDGIAPTSSRRMSWAEAASFAVEFDGSGGDDGVLVAFLKSEGGRSDKKQARELAARIPDEVLRAEILKGIR